MTRRFPLYEVKRRHNLGDPVYWNFRFDDMDIRMHLLETNYGNLEQIGESITQLGLERLDNGLTPIIVEALDRLQGILDTFGAGSVSSLAIGLGTKVFVIEEGSRNSFISGAFIYAQKTDDPTKFMFGRTVSYDPDTGELEVDVTFSGGAGTVADWRVTMTGPRGPQGQVGEAEGASQIGIEAIVGLDADNVQEALEEINGDLGAFISATTIALAGKAAASHTHPTSEISGLDASLSSKALASDLATTNAAVATKAPIASPTFTGLITAPDAAIGQEIVTISADQNDYSPANWLTKTSLVLDSSAHRLITGFAAPSTSGNIRRVTSISAFPILLLHENTGSSAANRLRCPGNVHFELMPYESVDLQYVGGSLNRWVVCGRDGWRIRSATADVAVTNDNTNNVDTDLFFWARPSEAYAVKAWLWFDGFDAQFSFVGPTLAKMNMQAMIGLPDPTDGGGTGSFFAGTDPPSGAGDLALVQGSLSSFTAYRSITLSSGTAVIEGIAEIGSGAVASNFAIAWSQSGAGSGTPTTRRRGSWLQWRRVW